MCARVPGARAVGLRSGATRPYIRFWNVVRIPAGFSLAPCFRSPVSDCGARMQPGSSKAFPDLRFQQYLRITDAAQRSLRHSQNSSSRFHSASTMKFSKHFAFLSILLFARLDSSLGLLQTTRLLGRDPFCSAQEDQPCATSEQPCCSDANTLMVCAEFSGLGDTGENLWTVFDCGTGNCFVKSPGDISCCNGGGTNTGGGATKANTQC
jgi:hypothetical protein